MPLPQVITRTTAPPAHIIVLPLTLPMASSPLTLLVLASLSTPSRRAPLGAAQACARGRPPLDRSRGRLCQSGDVSCIPQGAMQACAELRRVRSRPRPRRGGATHWRRWSRSMVSRSLNRILMYHAVGKRYSGARDRITASACSRVSRLSNKQLEIAEIASLTLLRDRLVSSFLVML